MALAYLLDPQIQISDKNGALNVAGFLRVYLNGTDDRATTYKDFNGTLNTADIVLDNNGRAVVIADSSRTYRLEVYTPDGALLWSQYPLNTLVGGAGGASGVVVESSDGTVDVTRYNDGGFVHYDLSTQVTNEASSWGGIVMRGTGVEGDMMWHPVPVDSTQGPAPYSTGWVVEKNCVADIAAALEFSCDNRDALNTVDVQCEFVRNGAVERTEGGIIDPTQPKGRVSFEYKGAVSEGDKVDCRIYVRCSQDVTLFLGGYAVYNEEVDGVVGGGSGGGVTYEAGDYIEITTANVINVTGLQPSGNYVTNSTFTSYTAAADVGYVHTGDMSGYATTADLSTKLDSSASSAFVTSTAGLVTTSDLSNYLPTSSIGVDSASAITSIAGSSIAGCGATGNYVEKSSINVAIGNSVSSIATAFAQGQNNTASLHSFAQGLDNKASLHSFAQGQNSSAEYTSFAQGFACIAQTGSFAQGNNSFAYNSSVAIGDHVAAYNGCVAFGAYDLWDNPDYAFVIGDGFYGGGTGSSYKHNLFTIRKNGAITVYSSTSDNTGIELVSTINSKLDSSASSAFITSTANCQPSGDYVSSSDMSAYIPYSALGIVEV